MARNDQIADYITYFSYQIYLYIFDENYAIYDIEANLNMYFIIFHETKFFQILGMLIQFIRKFEKVTNFIENNTLYI